MQGIIKALFSMKAAVVMMVLYGAVIGAATFIENDYGTQTARALIYKAKWFEVFQLYFILILIYNILRYKSYKTKFAVFLFHAAFVLIALGAFVTRYFGYEGIMHIREGATKQVMVSDVKVFDVVAGRGKPEVRFEKTVFFSSMTPNYLSESFRIGEKEVSIDLKRYYPAFATKAIEDPNGKRALELKISTGKQGKEYFIAEGDVLDMGQFYVSYNAQTIPSDKPTLKIEGKEALKVHFPYILQTLSMDTQKQDELMPGTHPFQKRMLYRFGANAVVFKELHPKARIVTYATSLKNSPAEPEYIAMEVCVEQTCKEVVFTPLQNRPGKIKRFALEGIDFEMRVGAKIIELPFALKLEDFVLERYPGSQTPSSYSSHVVLIDKEQNLTMPYHIYMNHVLDHRNYRFFQSSYDPDEKGTVLSVNHDPGTLITYIGYALMSLGMLWSLFIPNGRFQRLYKKAKALQAGAVGALSALALLFQTVPVEAKPTSEQIEHMKRYDAKHAESFGKLAVQDFKGRMKPVDTLAHEVISKITGKTEPFGIDPARLFLGMIIEPEFFQQVPMIKIKHPKIAKKLGLDEDAKFAKFTDFFTPDAKYKIFDDVTKATRKKPAEQSAYDKEVIKADERVNVAFMTFQGSFLRIYPKPNDENHKWYAPIDAIKTFPPEAAKEVQISIFAYFKMIEQALKSGDWSNADIALRGIGKIQDKYGSAVKPSIERIEWEIWYNKLGLFGKLIPIYLLGGVALLILSFVQVFRPQKSFRLPLRLAVMYFGVAFLLHVFGMGMRWYIAGHAPWSNAYEALVFIAASTMFAGLLIARNFPFALAGSAILAGVTMGVAHLSFIDPHITTLVPVLKSYWLVIHVATIISGDGFLGLGSILALMTLVLFALRAFKPKEGIDRSIKELLNLSEMSLIVGLFLLTIGNFLGGVWANESWGRYWGWDSKETWAAVTILIYAAVLHLRFVKAFQSPFVYAVSATWAYFTVLMTYFGVNYYLSGLHSYAAGDPLPIPTWVYVAVANLFVLTLAAYRGRKSLERI